MYNLTCLQLYPVSSTLGDISKQIIRDISKSLKEQNGGERKGERVVREQVKGW